ncbi:unnamed protein product [Lampetra fluviatilis]
MQTWVGCRAGQQHAEEQQQQQEEEDEGDEVLEKRKHQQQEEGDEVLEKRKHQQEDEGDAVSLSAHASRPKKFPLPGAVRVRGGGRTTLLGESPRRLCTLPCVSILPSFCGEQEEEDDDDEA